MLKYFSNELIIMQTHLLFYFNHSRLLHRTNQAGLLAMITIYLIFPNVMVFAQYDMIPDHTIVILNPIPSSISTGHLITFSGKLMTSSKMPIADKTIYIQYDSPYQSIRTLASATTDYSGNFQVTWQAVPKHKQSGGTYFIFANFYGDDQHLYSYSDTYPLTVPYLQEFHINCYHRC
jgi:hypothetical protein